MKKQDENHSVRVSTSSTTATTTIPVIREFHSSHPKCYYSKTTPTPTPTSPLQLKNNPIDQQEVVSTVVHFTRSSLYVNSVSAQCSVLSAQCSVLYSTVYIQTDHRVRFSARLLTAQSSKLQTDSREVPVSPGSPA
ncbi:unnamed protein product [Ambrosiozyma monospora]|uniref:Unnamed protein product n=1 Tax=Ambrosiozyma monospora TaxID=43982 RepID=A0ACB5TAC0_AMBMO|nr:unnamed protein product [Ambrosiozyma monospora]